VAQAGLPGKSAQERADLVTLLGPLPDPVQAPFLALWDEYEQGSSPEARLVKALDKVETIVQHNQGLNPASFDYAFNLDYGQKHMAVHPVFAQICALVDAETGRRHRESLQARGAGDPPGAPHA
jgi:putative hydrolases of HD superfamily